MSRSTRAPGSRSICAPSSGVKVCTGERLPASSPRNTRSDGARHRDGLGRVVGEVAAGVAVGVRQRHPQLDAVQDRRRGGGDLRMADARARPSSGSASPGRTNACTPALSRCSISPSNSQLTVCSPVCGCGGTSMPVPSRDVVRAVVVGEAPRADQRPLPLRQGASHPDGARPAQRDFPGMQHTGECRCRASHFGRRGIGVAHRLTVALRPSAEAAFNSARSGQAEH